jgi:integrase
MVTGVRRAELLALRWSDVDLSTGYLTVSRNYLRVRGKTVEKDAKTHQIRRISLDPATVEVLTEHRRYEELVRQADKEPTNEAFLFSYEIAHDRPYDPRSATAMRACALRSVSTAACMPSGTTPRLSCSPPADSATAAEARPRGVSILSTSDSHDDCE